jgi:polysaccharide biosynthesis protein PelD
VLAQLGEGPAVAADDALVRYALERDRLAHVQLGRADGAGPTHHLVAAPLRIGRHRLRALLVVSRMPFLALHDETLQMIAVLCSAFSAAAEVSEAVAGVLAQVSACPPRLAEELCRLDRIAREHAIVSHLVLLRFDDPLRTEEQGLMAQRRARAPDVTWAYTNAQGAQRLLTLMPLAGPASVEGYLASFTEMVTSRYRDERAAPGLASLRIGVRVLALGGAAAVGATLRELVAEDVDAGRPAPVNEADA